MSPKTAAGTWAEGEQAALDAVVDEEDDRPDDCECGEWNAGDRVDLPCWPCYRDGFEDPNPPEVETDE